MKRNPATLVLVAIPFVLVGCGARTPTSAPVSGPPLAQTAVVTAIHLERPMKPLPPRAAPLFAIESPSGGAYALRLVDGAGATLAATLIPGDAEWSTAAGSGGAYWISGGELHLLTPSGSQRTLAAVPADASGLLISPDGASFAYATASVPSASGVIDNRIVVQRFGSAARVVGDRRSDPAHPASDAPTSWTYMLLRWTSQGILLERDAYGGCGCGPFDMQMQAAYTALIDPVTSGTTNLTSDADCPLSGLGPYRSAACFHGGVAVDELRLSNENRVTARFALPGTGAAGDATFAPDGSALAYVTETETSTEGCGGTWQSTMHLLTLAGGSVRSAAIADFGIAAWPSASRIYGVENAASAWSLVAVDPGNLGVSTVWSGPAGSHLVGLT